MFSRFTTALYNAVDALAPPLPLQEDFVWHWKSVTKYYTAKSSSNKIPIEVTSIPGHLFQMLSILEQEEQESELESIGPCMEYVMQHKLLDTMSILGTSDTPPGMKRYMLIFVTRLLKNTQQSLIPHVSIYTPIQKFIKLCGEVLAAPTEKEEIDFLEVVCDKFKDNPYLVNCFLNYSEEGSRWNSVKDGGEDASKNSLSANTTLEYPLVNSLLILFQSPDNNIARRASNCLIICSSVANDTAATAVVQSTNMSCTICSCIITSYTSLPNSLKPSDIEESIASLGSEDGSNEIQISSVKRKLLCYFQHLYFIDTLTQQAHPLIADSIASCFKMEFLDKHIYFSLIDINQEIILLVTTLISCSVRHVLSSKLMSSFGFFLLGESNSSELSEENGHAVKNLLIERCRNSKLNLPIAMATLQLFEELLQRPTEHILHNLVIGNLESRGYYDHTAADSYFGCTDDDAYSKYEDDVSPGSSPVNKTFAPTYIHRILDCFLSLLPEDIKSCETEEESGYDTYIKEAHGRFVKCLMLCENFDWPQEPICKEEYNLGPEDDSSSDSQPEVDSSGCVFYEGAFLNMIFEKLEQTLEQPYDINLQVTSLISRLALFVHPNLHEYLLNPLIPLTPGSRSLFFVLLKVVEDMQIEVKKIKVFKKKLQLTRNSLLSEGNEYATFDESNVLEALIVIEEFCKELAAIAFAKYHAAS